MDEETIHGMSWEELLQVRQAIAIYWYRRQGERNPLEEYLSIGNETLARCLQEFPQKTGYAFLPYVRQHLHLAMRHVRLAWNGMGNNPRRSGQPRQATPRIRVLPVEPGWAGWARRPVAATCMARMELLAVDTFVETSLPAGAVQCFDLIIAGWTEEEIATKQGISVGAVQRAIRTTREAIRQQFSAQNTRRPHRVLRAHERTLILELWQAGYSMRAIGKRLNTYHSNIRHVVQTALPGLAPAHGANGANSRRHCARRGSSISPAEHPDLSEDTLPLDHAGGGTEENHQQSEETTSAFGDTRGEKRHTHKIRRVLIRYSLDTHPEDTR